MSATARVLRAAFDADEGCDISDLTQVRGYFLRDELTIGEDLKIAIGMFSEYIEQFRVHERLTAENAEEAVPMLARVVNRAI